MDHYFEARHASVLAALAVDAGQWEKNRKRSERIKQRRVRGASIMRMQLGQHWVSAAERSAMEPALEVLKRPSKLERIVASLHVTQHERPKIVAVLAYHVVQPSKDRMRFWGDLGQALRSLEPSLRLFEGTEDQATRVAAARGRDILNRREPSGIGEAFDRQRRAYGWALGSLPNRPLRVHLRRLVWLRSQLAR